MYFKYRVLKAGKMVSGRAEGKDAEEVTRFLKRSGMFPVEVRPLALQDISLFERLFPKISFSEIVNLTRQFSITLNAGLTLIDTLDIMIKQTNKPEVSKLLKDIAAQIREGKSFSESLQKYPMYFSRFYIALVKAGESSGKLNDILTRLATTLEKQRELRGKVKGAFSYPAVIVVMMFVLIGIMVIFVLPQLANLYRDFNVSLPMTTQMMIAFSGFLINQWYLAILILFGVVFLIERLLHSEEGQLLIDQNILKIPVFNKIIQMSLLVDVSRTLAILISSGVSILDALNIVSEIVNNRVYQQALIRIRSKVAKGTPIDNAIEAETIFPPIFIHMTVVGVQSGHLDETLSRISVYFESESEMALKSLTTMIEPAILIVMGVIIGFLVFSIITPIYQLTSSFN